MPDYFKRLWQNYLKDILSFHIKLPEEHEQCSTVLCLVLMSSAIVFPIAPHPLFWLSFDMFGSVWGLGVFPQCRPNSRLLHLFGRPAVWCIHHFEHFRYDSANYRPGQVLTSRSIKCI